MPRRLLLQLLPWILRSSFHLRFFFKICVSTWKIFVSLFLNIYQDFVILFMKVKIVNYLHIISEHFLSIKSGFFRMRGEDTTFPSFTFLSYLSPGFFSLYFPPIFPFREWVRFFGGWVVRIPPPPLSVFALKWQIMY